jgi:gamma-glutamylcysteine synthetase
MPPTELEPAIPASEPPQTHAFATGIGIKELYTFFISNFRRVLYVVCFLLGNSPASEFYMPTFRNTLSHLHGQVGKYYLPSCL